jgi:hypothetical protein
VKTGLTQTIIFIAIFISAAALVTWQATGGDYYTKFEVIEQVEVPIDQNDPLAQTGFYEGDTHTETVRKSGFRMGLLPTPSGLIDKHLVSVTSIVVPTWLIAFIVIWKIRRDNRFKTATLSNEQ